MVITQDNSNCNKSVEIKGWTLSKKNNLENEDTKRRKEINKAKPNGKDNDKSKEIENREKVRRMKEEIIIEQSEDKKDISITIYKPF